jgi:hypothetical protein
VREPRKHFARSEELDPIGQRDHDVAVLGRVRTPDARVERDGRVRSVPAVKGAAVDVDPGENAVVPARALRKAAPNIAQDI